MKYYFLALQNFADFSRRATRKEYWYFVLFNVIFAYAILGIGMLAIGEDLGMGPYSIYVLGVLIPSVAVGVRRMHDAGKSGWFILVPVYNFILAVSPSDPNVNKWGAPKV